jgi:imidazolonepropionase-like amidohydrolase
MRPWHILHCIALATLAIGVISCSDRRELVAGSALTVLEGATLIDGTGRAPITNAAVVLDGKQIVRVGRVGDFRYARGVDVQNLSGRYVLPGFIDMHVHPRLGAERETVQMLLAFGVTTIRIPGIGSESPDNDTLGIELRNQIAAGTLVGPRIFTGAKIVEGPRKTFANDHEVKSEAEIRAEVRQHAALGADLVKLYWNTPKEFIRAAVDEAHWSGLQVVAHVRQSSWIEACEAGIDGLVHSAGDGPTWELLAPDERTQWNALPYRQRYSRFEQVNLDSPLFDSLVTCLVNRQVTVDPTLVIMQTLYFGDDLDVLRQLEPEKAPASVLASWGKSWEKGNPFVLENVGGQDLTYGKAVFRIARDIVRRFHERGVRLVAGTDVGMPWVTPGVSLHRELQLMVQAGIPPSQVLSIATKHGAEGLKSSARFGTITPGLAADLVVLRENPMEDIRHTRSIEVVYKEGRRIDPQSLLANLR